ncbi:hypothetical protein ACFPRL_07605 [Pseudoclavibacter helvolus]
MTQRRGDDGTVERQRGLGVGVGVRVSEALRRASWRCVGGARGRSSR